MFDPKLIEALQSGKNIDAAVREAAAPMREGIRRMVERPDFLPFIISMTSGHKIEIRHPRQVELSDGTASIRVADANAPGGWRQTSTISLIHVVSLEPQIPDSPAHVVATRPVGDSNAG